MFSVGATGSGIVAERTNVATEGRMGAKTAASLAPTGSSSKTAAAPETVNAALLAPSTKTAASGKATPKLVVDDEDDLLEDPTETNAWTGSTQAAPTSAK